MSSRSRLARCISAQLASRMCAEHGMRHDGGAAWAGDWQRKAAGHSYRAQLMLTMMLHNIGAADAASILNTH